MLKTFGFGIFLALLIATAPVYAGVHLDARWDYNSHCAEDVLAEINSAVDELAEVTDFDGLIEAFDNLNSALPADHIDAESLQSMDDLMALFDDIKSIFGGDAPVNVDVEVDSSTHEFADPFEFKEFLENSENFEETDISTVIELTVIELEELLKE